jgi:hypothetical protein
MLHVPQIGVLVVGDVVYNVVHLYLTESGGSSGIDSWLAALDVAEALRPATVIAGTRLRRKGRPGPISGRARLLDLRAPTAGDLGIGRGVLPRHASAAPHTTEFRRAVGRRARTVPIGVSAARRRLMT